MLLWLSFHTFNVSSSVPGIKDLIKLKACCYNSENETLCSSFCYPCPGRGEIGNFDWLFGIDNQVFVHKINFRKLSAPYHCWNDSNINFNFLIKSILVITASCLEYQIRRMPIFWYNKDVVQPKLPATVIKGSTFWHLPYFLSISNIDLNAWFYFCLFTRQWDSHHIVVFEKITFLSLPCKISAGGKVDVDVLSMFFCYTGCPCTIIFVEKRKLLLNIDTFIGRLFTGHDLCCNGRALAEFNVDQFLSFRYIYYPLIFYTLGIAKYYVLHFVRDIKWHNSALSVMDI